MRWRNSSPQPNIMVAVVRSPSEWATRCISSQSSLVHFSRAIFARTSSSRISAPPPGMDCRPASISRWIVSRMLISLTSAMHRISGADEFQHFVDFLVNLLEREDVAVLGAERPVEGAEGTILGAEIRVVDVAVDLVGDDAGVVFLPAHLVRGHADAHEVIGFEHVQSLLFCQSQDVSSFRFRINCSQDSCELE